MAKVKAVFFLPLRDNDGRTLQAEIDETEFMSLVEPNVVAPHVMSPLHEVRVKAPNERAWDYEEWERSLDLPPTSRPKS